MNFRRPPRTLVAGAGLAGLAAGDHLGDEAMVIDREKDPGGTARSIVVDGFTFDYTGHLLHLHHPTTKSLIRRLLKGNVVECVRRAFIRSHGVETPYPFQANLHGLPRSVVEECVEGVRRARRLYGEAPLPKGRPLSFAEWSLRLFGAGISRHFMIPYNEKLWGVPSGKMTPEWCGPFVPVPTLAEVEAGARRPHRKRFGYNSTFLYPRRGGIQVLARALARRVPDLRLGVALEKVDWRKRRATLSSGEVVPYRRLLSSIPLPELVRRLDPFPLVLEKPLSRLRWTTVMCINVGVARPRVSKASWIYYPEKKYPFYRVGFPMNFSPFVVPRGCSSMYVEVSCSPGRAPVSAGDRQGLFRDVRAGLIDAGILKRSDRLPVVQFLPIPYAYVIYDEHREAAVTTLMEWLAARAGALSFGRYGGWKYSFMEEAILDGRAAAANL